MAAFSCNDAFWLVRAVAEIAEDSSTDGTTQPVAACAMMAQGGVAVPVASFAMDGVKPASVNIAHNKCATVLAFNCNTHDLASYTLDDANNARAAYPFFNSWDGGIRVYHEGVLVCALAVSGRTPKGDRLLAVQAAHRLGCTTDFNTDGLTQEEAAQAGRIRAVRTGAVESVKP